MTSVFKEKYFNLLSSSGSTDGDKNVAELKRWVLTQTLERDFKLFCYLNLNSVMVCMLI